MKRHFTILLTILLAGCGGIDEISEDSIEKEANEFAKTFIERLNAGDVDYCFNQMDSQFQDSNARMFFNECYDSVKGKSVKSTSVVSYQTTTLYTETPSTNYQLSYEYEFNDLWVYYTFTLLSTEDGFAVYNFNFAPYPDSLRLANEFKFEGKGIAHYFFFGLSILIPLFILTSLAFSIKTPLKRKWLWIIFILMGFMSFNFNWTTGVLDLNPMNFKLFGAGVKKSSMVGPWTLSFAIPLGAIMFWFKRSRIKKQGQNTEKPEILDVENGN